MGVDEVVGHYFDFAIAVNQFERGFTERYNRIIGEFDRSAVLPISAAAEGAYAANPRPELVPANFKVAGGSIYPGTRGVDRQLWRPALMLLPRLAAAYQLGSKMVIRGGYGMFFDTLNVLNQGASQTNYSRTTSANISNDFGYTWLVADPQNGKPPMSDPFPIRADGTRFDVPTRDALGLMAVAGRSFTFDSYDQKRARQQRWRLSFQRQLGKSYLVDAAYAGSYSDRVYIDNSDNAFNKNLNAVPEQYYAAGWCGMTRLPPI